MIAEIAVQMAPDLIGSPLNSRFWNLVLHFIRFAIIFPLILVLTQHCERIRNGVVHHENHILKW